MRRHPREQQDPSGPTDGTTLATGRARFTGVRAWDVVECVDLDAAPERVAAGGWWAVVGEFDGPVRAWRFANVARGADPVTPTASDQKHRGYHAGAEYPAAISGGWYGPHPSSWTSSMSAPQYRAAVQRTREYIRSGDVYQANICRVLQAPLRTPSGTQPDAAALADLLAAGNPAPYAGMLQVEAGPGVPGAWVVSASPELFLSVADGVVTSAPIKGTALDAAGLTEKDRAENVMITDLVRNDLQRVCDPGTVEVTALLAMEHHPGLVHLVSTVAGRLRPDVRDAPDAWAATLAATFPPGSVSGAPKSSALRVIAELEPVARGPYCGAFGWIDADAGTARLAVGIRTFWWDDDDGGTLRFGTGAGITWGSDPEAEWHETQLKARHLVALASTDSQGPHATR